MARWVVFFVIDCVVGDVCRWLLQNDGVVCCAERKREREREREMYWGRDEE